MRKVTKLTAPGEVQRAKSEQLCRLAEQQLPLSWANLGMVFEDQYIRITRDPVRFPSGQLGTYIRIDRREGSVGGVIAVPRMGNAYLLVRHYRYATSKLHLEFPRGFIDDGETAEQAVLRELKEEIGATALSLMPLGCLYADTGLQGFSVQVFAIDIAEYGAVALDEGIEGVELLTAEQLLGRVGKGKMDCSLTMSAFLLDHACRNATL